MPKAGDEFRYRKCVIRVTGAIASVSGNFIQGNCLIYTAFGFKKENRGRSFIAHCDDLDAAKRAIDAWLAIEANVSSIKF